MRITDPSCGGAVRQLPSIDLVRDHPGEWKRNGWMRRANYRSPPNLFPEANRLFLEQLKAQATGSARRHGPGDGSGPDPG